MKTCKQLREGDMWLLEEELAWLLEMTEKEIQDYLAPEGGLRLVEEDTRNDVGWIALGIFYWSALGVTDDATVAANLGVRRGMVRRGRAFIQSLRDEANASPRSTREPFAIVLVARPEDLNAAWCTEHGLLAPDHVGEQVVIPLEDVRRAIHDLVRARRRAREGP